MVKSEKKRNPVWLELHGYHIVALKPELDEHAVELERAIQSGIPAYPDLARADFYDVALEEGWAYIHVYRDGHAVYLVAYFLSTFNSSSTRGSDDVTRPKMRQIDLLEEVHRRLACGPHWHLMVLGVEPSNRDALGENLIEPVLSQADAEGVPCYLETFNPGNVTFYKKLGFRIEGAGQIPGGPNFWAMVRAPQGVAALEK